MADINITASIRTLNLNVLSSLMKEDGSAEWVIPKKIYDQAMCYLQEAHFKFKDVNKLKNRRMEKTYHAISKKELEHQ